MTNDNPLPDPATLEPAERLAYVNEIRGRMMEDPASVSEEEIKHSLAMLRMDRSSAAATSAAKRQSKEPVAPIADDFF